MLTKQIECTIDSINNPNLPRVIASIISSYADIKMSLTIDEINDLSRGWVGENPWDKLENSIKDALSILECFPAVDMENIKFSFLCNFKTWMGPYRCLEESVIKIQGTKTFNYGQLNDLIKSRGYSPISRKIITSIDYKYDFSDCMFVVIIQLT